MCVLMYTRCSSYCNMDYFISDIAQHFESDNDSWIILLNINVYRYV